MKAILAPLLAVSSVLLIVGSATLWNQRNKEMDELRHQLALLSAKFLPDDTAISSDVTEFERALQSQPSCSCPSSFTYASDFGIVGDGSTDDAPAIQAAINSAASNNDAGGTVILPKGTFLLKASLEVPGGVTLKGQGYGSSPLAIQFDAGSSVLAYCGTDYAVKITGHSSSIQDLAVYDWRYPVGGYCDNVQGAGGILIDADNKPIESTTISNVLIYWFMGGTGLTMRARNSGGMAYSNIQNLRIRHGLEGIRLSADSTSFVNSNSFVGGAISGGITDVGLIAEGPGACNDNKFYGMVIEPPSTNIAHVYVTGEKTNVRLLDVRLEGTDMFAPSKPLVIIDDSSYGNVMTGMLGHTHIQADLNRNPEIDFTGGKVVGLDPAPVNMLWNAAFIGFDANSRSMPGWSLPGLNWEISVLDDSEALHADHKVLRVDYLNYGGPFKLKYDVLPKSNGHSFVTFGIYARSSVANSIASAMRYESGSIISSISHSGSGEWEFIGMSALYDQNAPYFYFSITGDVDITAPTLVYGQTPATPGASLMSSSGAKMSGSLSLGLTKAYPPPSETPYYWTLPLNGGNIFEMDMEGNPSRSIIRINDAYASRFPRGTVITLLFPEAGTTVKHNAYIKLNKNTHFVSTENSSLTLVTHGGPTWTEISRNN